jgi:hypothetical protein
MTNKTCTTEKSLLYRLECPLRSDGSTSGPESPVLYCAESTARWLIDEIDAGRQPTEGETREFFNVQWQQTDFFQAGDTISPKDYNHQVEEDVLACSCVRNLIRRCESVQPVSPYTLPVDGITMSGEHAVLHAPRRKMETFIPYFQYARALTVFNSKVEV